MTQRATPRPMLQSERQMLERILEAQSSRARRWKSATGNAVVLWAASMLGMAIVWAALAWLVRRATSFDYGWRSPAAIWIALAGIALCAVIAVTSTVRWVRTW